MTTTEPLLRVDDLQKSFGDETVLDGIDFEMDERDVRVLIGPSGSGKSTVLRCVNRLTEPDGGTIYLDGQDTGRMDENELRQDIGMVFQGFNLFAHLTARGNVALPLRRVRGYSKAEAYERADEELAKVQLAGQGDSYPAELSGGQKQRVGIARALAMDPKLMLFDEPTSALDPELIGDVLGIMRELADEGMTMLVVTHEMRFAREVATEVMFLDNGRIVEQNEPTQLFESPREQRTQQFLHQFMNPLGE